MESGEGKIVSSVIDKIDWKLTDLLIDLCIDLLIYLWNGGLIDKPPFYSQLLMESGEGKSAA